MGAVTDSIGSGKDFETIVLWEASLNAHAGDDVTGEGYNEAYDETPVINDATPDSVTLSVAVGERHDGTAGTGARITRTGTAAETILTVSILATVSWFEISATARHTGNFWGIDCNAAGSVFDHLIMHDLPSTDYTIGIDMAGAEATVHNSILYALHSNNAAADVVFALRDIGDNAGAFNVTAHDITNDNGSGDSHGLEGGIAGAEIAQNCVVTDVGGTTSGATLCFADLTTNENNLSSDATATGAGCLINKPAADQYISTAPVNLHLKAGADAIGVGVDLVQTPAGVEFDIDNFDRHTEAVVWDMGADQYVAAVVGQPMMRRWGGVPHMPWGAPTPSGRSW